jgi:4-amino-4-deoxy-L-arabinose transferase-like glycosyltransferase
MPATSRTLTTAIGVAALTLYALVLIARWPLLDRPFSLEGEAREATCIADVVREGHWLAPYPNGDWIPTKGPLLYWWAGAAASVFGLSERVMRLSIAALNLGTLLATAWLGHLLGSARAGWLAAAMLATCFLFSGYAFYLRVDPALVLCTTLTLASFAWGLARPERRRVAFLASHAALAGALLAKGLPALLPTLLPILGTLAWRRDVAGLRTFGFSALLLGALAAAKFGGWASAGVGAAAAVLGLWPWLRAPPAGADALLDLIPGLTLVAVLGGWLALADARYPVPYMARVVDDRVNRVGQTMQGDPFLKPPWFYLPRLPGDFFPWSIFLPAAVVAAVRGVRRDSSDLRLLALLCALLGFVVFSVIAYKRKVYLLPLYPAAAVLIGLLFASEERAQRWLEASLGVVVVLGIAAASAAVLDLAARAPYDGGGLFALLRDGETLRALRPHWLLVDLPVLAAGVLWASSLHLSRRRGASLGALAIATGMALVLAGPATLIEFANAARARTPDVFAAAVREAVPAGAELRFAPRIRDEGLLFYLGRRVPATRAEELEHLLEAAPASGLYFIAHRADELPHATGVDPEIIARGVGSNGSLVLVRATPEPRS